MQVVTTYLPSVLKPLMENKQKTTKGQEPSGSGHKESSDSDQKRRESSDSASNKSIVPLSQDKDTNQKIANPEVTNLMTPTGANASCFSDKQEVMEGAKKKRNRKRPRRTPDASSTPSPTAQAKRPKQSSASYSEMAATVKMALVPESFPTGKLTKDQATDIQAEMNVLIDDISDDNQPLFSSVGLANGALIVHCIGAPTVDWLKNTLHGKSLKGVQLRVLTAAELPKPVKLILKTRDTRTHDPAVLLKRLGRQNRGLVTEDWRLLTKERGSDHTRWIFEIDQGSASTIRGCNMELFCGAFGKGLCKLFEAPAPKPQSAATDVAMEEEEIVAAAAIVEEKTPDDVDQGGAVEASPSVASDQVSVDGLLAELEIGSDNGSDVTIVSSTELLANVAEFNDEEEGLTS